MNILLTGATGFVGCPTAAALTAVGHRVVCAVRHLPTEGDDVGQVAVGDIDGTTDWTLALNGCDVVVHLAARAHVMHEEAVDPLAAYQAINTDGALKLARDASKAGVRRFVFLSSIKVNGEHTKEGRPFKYDDVTNPIDAYAISKRNAEFGLQKIALETGMEVVVIRPPLVYGVNVKGNFRTLIRIVASGIPLPLGAVTDNRRSLVALDNLVDLIVTCVSHPEAANQTFLVADGEDLSTAALVDRLGQALEVPAFLFSIPQGLLMSGARLLGKEDMAHRLVGNLQVDSTYTCEKLGWNPVVTVAEGLRRAVRSKK